MVGFGVFLCKLCMEKMFSVIVDVSLSRSLIVMVGICPKVGRDDLGGNFQSQ